MIEGSGSGSIPLTNRSGSGSGRPKTCGSGTLVISFFDNEEEISFISSRKREVKSSAAANAAQQSLEGKPGPHTKPKVKGLNIFVLRIRSITVEFNRYGSINKVCNFKEMDASVLFYYY
jgi:hypothetical protein